MSKEGNCLFDDWGIPINNISPVNPPDLRNTELNNEPLNNRKDPASNPGTDSNLRRLNKNANNNNSVNQNTASGKNRNDPSLSFFYSIITKLVDFMRITDKTSESCALFAWKVFDLVARHYNFSS